MTKTLSLMVFISSVVSAANYSCEGNYERKLNFDLTVGKTVATLKSTDSTCKTTIDPTYKPTVKYAGYSRFFPKVGGCKGFLEDMLGKENTFHSIKISGELKKGEREGLTTVMIDEGDYHGQLRIERVTCISR